jgi:hypothetical protein
MRPAFSLEQVSSRSGEQVKRQRQNQTVIRTIEYIAHLRSPVHLFKRDSEMAFMFENLDVYRQRVGIAGDWA